MKYSLSFLQPNEYSLVSELAEEVNLEEKIDFNCNFLCAKNGVPEKIIGVAGINLQKSYPQIEHIIVGKEHQKTSLAYLLMIELEKFLRLQGYKEYVAYILNSNERMIRYAKKFGFKPYANRDNAKWYYKTLLKER